MSKRALVVDLEMLEASRDLFREMAKTAPLEPNSFCDQADMVDRIIKFGIPVNLEPAKVAGWAKALCQVGELRERDGEADWGGAA